MRDRRSTAARGYGFLHQQIRARLAPEVATGTVRCARGADCLRGEGGLGGLILPDEAWDLGHDDHDPSRYAGPEHVACNRSTAGRRETYVDDRGVPRRWSRQW